MELGKITEKRTRAAIDLLSANELSMGYRIKISTSDVRGTWVFNSCWEPTEEEYCYSATEFGDELDLL